MAETEPAAREQTRQAFARYARYDCRVDWDGRTDTAEYGDLLRCMNMAIGTPEQVIPQLHPPRGKMPCVPCVCSEKPSCLRSTQRIPDAATPLRTHAIHATIPYLINLTNKVRFKGIANCWEKQDMVRGNFLLSAGDTTTPDLARSGFVSYPAALYGSLTAEAWAWQQLVYQMAYAQAQAAMVREQTGLSERISSILGPAWRN